MVALCCHEELEVLLICPSIAFRGWLIHAQQDELTAPTDIITLEQAAFTNPRCLRQTCSREVLVLSFPTIYLLES